MRRPTFIAEQARNARGLLGRVIAFIMARETWAANRRAIAALQVGSHDRVLDIGCGPGRSLGALAASVPSAHIVGVDPSALMVRTAARRNRHPVHTGQVEVMLAGAHALPFPDASFDKALCVHVVYFWRDLEVELREIARILKPGGRFVLLFRTSADEAEIKSFPADVYRFPALDEMSAALDRAGLAVELTEEARKQQASGPVILAAVKRGEEALGAVSCASAAT